MRRTRLQIMANPKGATYLTAMKHLLAPLLTLCLLAACTKYYPARSTPTAPDIDLDRLTPGLPIFTAGLIKAEQPLLAEMDGASMYRIDFKIANDLAHVDGKEEVRYTNRETVPLDQVEFRLFPNVLGGKMTVANLRVEGQPITPTYGLNNSLMIVPLASPLAIGASVTISMDFSVEVPTDVQLNYGVFAYVDGVLTLAHSYPDIPVYNEEGWNAEIPPQSGDLTFNDAAFYLVTVTAPKDVTLVASGVESAPVMSGSQIVQTVAAGPARDFFLAGSRDFQVVSQQVGETTVNSYAPKSLKDGSQSVLQTAVSAIETFNDAYAPYPYVEFDVIATPTLAFGVEYPGAVAITERLYTNELYGQDTPIVRAATVAHEAAHQWFYNLVGNDQLDQPWLDESMAQFATWDYYWINDGESGARGFELSLRDRWARINDALIPIGQPVSAYTDLQYSPIIYGRGPLFLLALRNQMGSSSFDAFLKDYVSTFAWNVATTAEFQGLAEKHCGCDLSPLFDKWVYP